MDNSTFYAKIAELDKACDGVMTLARKHTADRKTETVGGWWRPFEFKSDLNCFICVFGKPADDPAKSNPFWNELWQYVEQYGVDVPAFRSRLVSELVYGCDTGLIGKARFLRTVREFLWDAIHRTA
ncbi:MAG: hypothetical protein AAB338_01040 [Patescibacteria group bacterium]